MVIWSNGSGRERRRWGNSTAVSNTFTFKKSNGTGYSGTYVYYSEAKFDVQGYACYCNKWFPPNGDTMLPYAVAVQKKFLKYVYKFNGITPKVRWASISTAQSGAQTFNVGGGALQVSGILIQVQ